jgi:hypothetical protein|tara:strand:- start:935 stop:1096 length:162 start_codon:yes stop_codon:yes gene_type:complete
MRHISAFNRKKDHTVAFIASKRELAEVLFAHFPSFNVGGEVSTEYRLIHDISL